MLKRSLIIFIILEIYSGFFLLSSYAFVQQDIRQSTYDTPYEISQNAMNALEVGSAPSEIIKTIPPIELEKSTSPFLIIYSVNGSGAVSSATLNNQTPILPSGVLGFTKENNEDRITWEPRNNIREAIVVKYAEINDKEFFIVGGQSLSQHERRTARILEFAVVFFIAITLINIILSFFGAMLLNKEKSK